MKTRLIHALLNRIELEPRDRTLKWSFLSTIFGLAVAGLLTSTVLIACGAEIQSTIAAIVNATTGSTFAVTETILLFVPLLMCSLGFTIAQKAGLWNIGGEGQLLLGALAGFVVSRVIPGNAASAGQIGAMSAAFLLSGCVFAAIAYAKVHNETDEVLVTLLSNFVAVYLIGYLVSGPLQDPQTKWIQSPPLADEYRFERVPGFGRVNWSIIIAALIAITLLSLEAWTHVDTALRITGSSFRSASLQRLNPSIVAVSAGFCSGGLCGLAGWIELAGTQYRLIENLSPGYGYTAVIVGVLSRGQILRTCYIALLFSFVLNAIDAAVRDVGIPSYTRELVLGVMLLVFAVQRQLTLNSIRLR